MYPLITVEGGPYDRGRQYGTAARERVHASIAAYAKTFRHYAGWDWERSTTEARRFLAPIEDFGPQYVEELSGIADGAGVDRDDILAINVRTEVMYSARVRNALAQPAPDECSVFAQVADDGHVIVGQNWDWAPFAAETVVALQAFPDDGPSFVTVVEAGLLAKYGVNSDGLAVMTNALACTEDEGEAGVPYHVMLRGLLDCSSTEDGVRRLEKASRASSANYLLADQSGDIVDLEGRPGATLHRLERDARGVLLHTNHFLSPDFDATDYADLVETTTRTRFTHLSAVIESADDPADLAFYRAELTGHANAPDSVCRHPDLTLPGPDQSMTVSSIVVDLTDRRVWLAEGPPCEHGFEELDCTRLWSRSASLR
jgi:isopenicillin-N N-acyltransferase like protein